LPTWYVGSRPSSELVGTGSSLASSLTLRRHGCRPRGSPVLYAHLGGHPALIAYSALFTQTQRVPL
jgi:1-aminocyclopropane-1-carboxylate deaminase/D-cysteine desulfhydrase-like pyridoxal-dependent ACC family enzyme